MKRQTLNPVGSPEIKDWEGRFFAYGRRPQRQLRKTDGVADAPGSQTASSRKKVEDEPGGSTGS